MSCTWELCCKSGMYFLQPQKGLLVPHSTAHLLFCGVKHGIRMVDRCLGLLNAALLALLSWLSCLVLQNTRLSVTRFKAHRVCLSRVLLQNDIRVCTSIHFEVVMIGCKSPDEGSEGCPRYSLLHCLQQKHRIGRYLARRRVTLP